MLPQATRGFCVTHASVTPIRQRRHDDDLDCNVSRVLGYRGVCRCEWKGPMRGKASEAREDVREHRIGCER